MENNQNHAFCALLSRMKYINRWGLMRCARNESLSEHTTETAVIAHILALIASGIYKDEGICPQTVLASALYHDASEILTGDMPTPVKYKNNQLKTAYKQLENESSRLLASQLPEELSTVLLPFLTGDALNEKETVLLKAADRLSALIKCIEEESSGNTEFKAAKAQQIELLKKMNSPAANYFMKHFLPCYQKNLDELTNGLSPN